MSLKIKLMRTKMMSVHVLNRKESQSLKEQENTL